MLQNYIKLAWRVLSRKKFFTFITLFGISFTLMILMLITSYFQAEFGARAPMKNQNDLVVLESLTMQRVMYDTIAVVDTIYESGVAKFDTSYTTNQRGRNVSISSFNEKILIDHFRDLESIKGSTIFNTGVQHDVFLNNSKLQISINHCDANFWDIFNFKFIEGRPFDASELDQQAQVTVIAQKLAKSYFGQDQNVVGNTITVDAKQYTVIGVVEDPTSSPDPIVVDMFIPYTNVDDDFRDPYFGMYSMVLWSDGNVDKTKKEVVSASQNISLDLQTDFNELIITPVTYKELYARGIYYD